MSIPVATIQQSGFAEMVLPKAGRLVIPLKQSVYNFPLSASKKGPRFFGNDGTGCYYGLAGYYRSYPCYIPHGLTKRLTQYSGFTVNALGIFDVSALQSNPFAYTTQLADTSAQVGSLPYPIDVPVTGKFSHATLGFHGLYVSTSKLFQFGTEYWKKEIAPFPALSFSDISHSFGDGSISVEANLAGASIYATRNTFFSVMDDNFQEYLSDVTVEFSVLNTIYGRPYEPMSCAMSISPSQYNPGQPFPINFYKNGRLVALDGGGLNNPYTVMETASKTHPINGNTLFCGGITNSPHGIDTGIWFYNAFAPSFDPGNGNLVIFPSHRYWITLSDPSDDAGFRSTITAIQQIASGGWILGNYNSQKWIVIPPDMSRYYSVEFVGYPLDGLNRFACASDPETFGVDLNGFFWALNYDAGGNFQSIYTSMGGPTFIELISPLLTGLTNGCRIFNACNLTWEG